MTWKNFRSLEGCNRYCRKNASVFKYTTSSKDLNALVQARDDSAGYGEIT